RFHEMMHDTLRGPLLSAVPFYDKKKLIALLDRVPTMSSDDRIAWDPILMSVLSACVIQKRFQLETEPAREELAPDLESTRPTVTGTELARMAGLQGVGHERPDI